VSLAQPEATPLPRPRVSATARRNLRTAWLFLAPMLAVLALVAAWPLLRTIFFSLTNATLVDTAGYDFIGLENYLVRDGGEWYGLLADPEWWGALGNTLLFTGITVFFETVFGVLIALILNASFRFRGLVRAAVLVPWAIPTVVSAKIWAWMLHDQFGMVNDLL